MRKSVLITILVFIMGCKPGTEEKPVSVEVDPATIGKHIEKLASDEFMGRMPCTEGEVKTVNYLKEEFSKLGALPGNGDSYFQDVPLLKFNGIPSEEMVISGDGNNIILKHFDDFMIVTEKAVPEVSLENSELVFAGYGIVAPAGIWLERL